MPNVRQSTAAEQEGVDKEKHNAMTTGLTPPRSPCYRSGTSIEYTDVVVIGNGPSGITVSYMLAGHWPYYTGTPHTDEYLQLRLEDGASGTSIVEQDLEFLSDGLEGRSSNPLALLFDALTHPDADSGVESPSLLHWEHKPQHGIPHVVLGRAAEGGIWQMLEGDVQTLSLGTWMQLADAPFKQWLTGYRREKRIESGQQLSASRQNRASMEEVKQYYMHYVQSKGLAGYFRNHSVVTSIERVLDVCHCIDDESGEQEPCSRDHPGKFKWEVRGHRFVEGEIQEFFYRAPNVVLATGTFDRANCLNVPGESFPYVLHSISALESRIREDGLHEKSDPVVIVGAGLSAADAVLYAVSMDIPIIHVFRREVDDPQIAYRQLPTALYPEYHQVHEMMKAGESHDGRYKAYPNSSISGFRKDHKVIIHTGGGCGREIVVQASYVVILIGSKPNLSFMPNEGRNLGVVPGMKIDPKHNPIEIDQFTHQSIHQPGLFAMGPLVGDNFVRFLRGGALGIAAHLWKQRLGKL